MLSSNARIKWCFGKNLLRKIPPSKKKADEHIQKAKHNLRAADYNISGGFSDWAVSQAYYAMYHGLLALLYKHGLESINHECTISAVENLIETDKVQLDKGIIAFIRTAEQMRTKDAKSLREQFQYGTKTEVNKIILNELLNKSKEVVEQIEITLLNT
jgi:uncharacterized protein (UPF0332 family)